MDIKMSRTIPLSTPGFLGEFFWVLAHPMSACFNVIVLALALLLQFEIDHVLVQALMGLLVCQALAQAETQNSSVRLSLWLWALGGFCMCVGLFIGYQNAGTLKITPGTKVESYQRGHDALVDYHLGNSLDVSRDDQIWTWRFGTGVSSNLSQEEWQKGVTSHIGHWSLSVLNSHKDPQRLQATFTLKARQGDWTKKITLQEGESFSDGSSIRLKVLRVVKDRGGQYAEQLGAAADVLITWEASKNKSTQLERAWHYVNAADLNSTLGLSPWIVHIDSIEYASVYQVRVQHRQSQQLIYWALVLWGISLLSVIWQRIRASQVTQEV